MALAGQARESYTPAWAWAWTLVAAPLGMGLVQTWPRLPSAEAWTAWLTALALVMTGCFALSFGRQAADGGGLASRRPWPWSLRWLSWTVLAFLLGITLAAHRAQLRLAELLPAALEGQVVTLTVRVAALPQRLSGIGQTEGWRMPVEVDGGGESLRGSTSIAAPAGLEGRPPKITARPDGVPARLLLNCYGMPSAPRVGERWQMDVKLKRPYGLMNPRAGDAALWMMEQDLPASGSCRSRSAQRLEAARGVSVERAREALREAIDAQVPEGRAAGVLMALSLGDQGAVRPSDWSLYRETGVSHLLSVSGLHVTMFAWLAGLIGGRLWRCQARLCAWCPAPRAAMWIGTVAAGGYAVFSGWGVPSQRTFGLVLTLSVLRQLGLRWPWGLSLAVAALAVGVMDPWALTQPGFWLSFCAVALLMASGLPTEPGAMGALVASLRAQWTITLGLAPLTLLMFQQLSVIGLLANAIAIPLVSYVITPLSMLGALWAPFWTVGAWMVDALHLFLEWLRDWPLAVWHLPWAPGWAQALGLIGGVIAALPWAWTWRLCGVALALPLLWPQTPRPPPGVLELWVPDVGQGGAAVLRTHRHTVLFDAGPRWGPASDAGERVLLPLLRGLGERRVDLMMVSHADQDHAGGANSVLRGMPVVQRRGAVAGARPCVRGETWDWDGVRFELLSPEAGEADEPSERRRNGASCVLRVSAGERRVLLTGDIDITRERRLVAREADDASTAEREAAVDRPPNRLQAEVIVVPHHGSKTSSSMAFVEAVAPRVAVVQSGYLNRFGHPREDVQARYQAIGAAWVNTVECGAWHWRSDVPLASQPVAQGCERARRLRYWLRPPSGVPGDDAAESGEEDPEAANGGAGQDESP